VGLSYHVVMFVRCNFALIFLSELVIDLSDVNWADHLPQLLHILCLGVYLASSVLCHCSLPPPCHCRARLTQTAGV